MSMPSSYRSPWTVALWPSADTRGEEAVWTRETMAEAFADVAEFSQLAIEHGKPVMLTVRDRGGQLVHQVVTTGYVPASAVLPGVPS